MLGVLQSNRENVLFEIKRFQHALTEIEYALENEDFESVENILNHTREIYFSLIQ